MPAQITLTVTEGRLRGRQFTFSEPATCVIGRAGDCNLRLPDDEWHRMVSRHHCLLDINPPDLRVRDFGSRNGTWLNGTKIGQREPGHTPEQGAALVFPEHDLRHGDELRVGETALRVAVIAPVLCADCETEIPEGEQTSAQLLPSVYQCRACSLKAERAGRTEPPRPRTKRCVVCGADISAEIGLRHGDAVCAACRADPDRVIRRLLETGVGAIANYRIDKVLGHGGMGAVYLARHTRTGERVALKVMLPEVAASEHAQALFLRETAIAKALTHPNIVGIHDHGCWHGIFYFTMQHCDRGDVQALIRPKKQLAVGEAVDIILQVLDGLAYAHQAQIPVTLHDGTIQAARGVVHRDLSPHNILLNGATAKISDFGLAKAFEAAGLSGHTRTGAAAGKPWFMPRQLVINFKHAKPDVDVWAAAACLYFLLTGLPPRDFPIGKDPWRVVLEDPPVPIRVRNRSIPKPLAEVVDRALLDRPEISIKTAFELRRVLQDAHR